MDGIKNINYYLLKQFKKFVTINRRVDEILPTVV
jgi:hypothetical protein